jgi:hypothetical protein
LKRARRLDLVFAAVVTLVAAVYLAQFLAPADSPAARLLSRERTLVFGAIVKLVFLALGAGFAARAARAFERGNPARPAWRLLAGGLGLYVLGQASLARHQVLRLAPAPFPSVADVFFVAGTVAFIAALAAFIRAYRRAGMPLGGRAQLGRAAAAGAVLVAAMAVWVLAPIAAAAAPFWAKTLNLAYPLLDAVLLVANLVLLDMAVRLRGGRVWNIWAALLAGFACTAVGDILFAFFSVVGVSRLDPLLNLTFALSYVFLALGARYQAEILAGGDAEPAPA